MRIDVLGVGFDDLTMAEAVERGMELVRTPGTHYVATPNPEIVEICREDPEARAAVNGADLVLPDGVGVVKGAAMLGTPLKEKTPGIEFAVHLMEKLAEEGKSLYLLGAKPGVAEQAAAKLAEAHQGLRIAGTHDGYFQEDGPGVEAIRQSGADVVFVCLGRPSRRSGWPRTAPPPAPICCAAWAAAWMCLPAWWSGPRSSGPTMGWSGSTACARSPAASAA